VHCLQVQSKPFFCREITHGDIAHLVHICQVAAQVTKLPGGESANFCFGSDLKSFFCPLLVRFSICKAEASDVTHGVFGLTHGGTTSWRDFHEPFLVYLGSLVQHPDRLPFCFFRSIQKQPKFWARFQPQQPRAAAGSQPFPLHPDLQPLEVESCEPRAGCRSRACTNGGSPEVE